MTMIKKISMGLLCTSIFMSQILYAEDNFESFLNEIEETTQIATKTKMNVIWAPGIVSVLEYDELKRLGARNLYDALNLIPNVTTDLYDVITIRGIGGVLGSGKTKVLINGIPQNIPSTAVLYLNMPIDLIDRIEILRGPGSVLYGEYALNGTVNIITKQQENSLTYNFEKLNKNHLQNGNINFFHQESDLKMYGTFSYLNTKGLEPYSKDVHGNAHNVETLEKQQTFIGGFEYKNFNLKLINYSVEKGELYGGDQVIPDNDGEPNFLYENKNIELSNKFILDDTLTLTPQYTYSKYISDLNLTKFRPTSVLVQNVPYNEYTQHKYVLDLNYKNKKNEFLLGLEHIKLKEDIGKVTLTFNQPPIGSFTQESTKSKDTRNKRTIDSIYLQNQYKINEQYLLSTGVRYEKYDDKYNDLLKDTVLPKLSLVYLHNNENIYKLQYGKASRPNTFLENKVSDPKEIKAETIDTVELQHILFKEKYKLVSTLYYSHVKNMIHEVGTVTNFWFENYDEDIISKGVELEYRFDKDKEYNILANFSYTNAYFKESKKQLSDYAKYIADIAFVYQPYSLFSSAMLFEYVGSKKRDEDDTREDFKSSFVANINFVYTPSSIIKNTTLNFGVKNLFDEIEYSPSRVESVKEDYVSERRSYYMNLNYKF